MSSIGFLNPTSPLGKTKQALIILNQPFSASLLHWLWPHFHWRCCADGGANQLYDVCNSAGFAHRLYYPDLIKGDLDSIRPDVQHHYTSHGIPIVQDHDQGSTDLMKCVSAVIEKESEDGQGEYDIVLLGGLSGRLDQTIHTLSYLHKLCKSRKHVFAITDESIAWVLPEGEHFIKIDHTVFGPTCGLLPVGIDSAVISTTGLKWNLTDQVTSFDGLVSTSNHLLPEEETVWVKTSRPILWTMELKKR